MKNKIFFVNKTEFLVIRDDLFGPKLQITRKKIKRQDPIFAAFFFFCVTIFLQFQ